MRALCWQGKEKVTVETMGAAFANGLTFKMSQTHVHRYLKPLLKLIQEDKIDPTFVITHCLSPEDAPGAYPTFRGKQDHCIKVILKPNGGVAGHNGKRRSAIWGLSRRGL